MHSLAGTTLIVSALAWAAGCQASFGGVSPDEEELEEELVEQITEEVGAPPDDIDCPGDLRGRVDEEMRCTLTAHDDELDVVVTVTDVDGRNVNFHFEVVEP